MPIKTTTRRRQSNSTPYDYSKRNVANVNQPTRPLFPLLANISSPFYALYKDPFAYTLESLGIFQTQ